MRHCLPAPIVVFVLASSGSNFQGGKKGRRDRWYGFEKRDDFSDFRRWWHRIGKDTAGGMDLQSRQAAEEAYNDWVSQGKPTAR
jgi:hypothetical protein